LEQKTENLKCSNAHNRFPQVTYREVTVKNHPSYSQHTRK